MKKITITILLAAVLAPTARAVLFGETTDPMVIGGGARPLGMGRASVAIAEDADAPFINPAGIAGLRGPQAMSMFTNLLEDVYYIELCGSVPSRIGSFGVGMVATGSKAVLLPQFDNVYSDYYDNMFLLSYGAPLANFFEYGRNIYLGLNLKYFSRGWTGGIYQSAAGYSADFGIKFIATPYLSFGYNRQNFLPVDLGGVIRYQSGAEEAVSSIHKMGVAVRPKQFASNLLLALDVDLPAQSGRPATAHLGVEWKTNELLMVRMGADQSLDAATPTKTSWNPTFGVSLEYFGFRIDYAHHPYYNDPAYATNYISLSYRGEPRFALIGETR